MDLDDCDQDDDMGDPLWTDSGNQYQANSPNRLEDMTNLANSELKTFNPNKSFSFSRTYVHPYSKPPTNVASLSTNAAHPNTMVPQSDTSKKRKSSTANLFRDFNISDEQPTKKAKMSTIPGPLSKRKRKTKGPPIQQRAIPRSFDDCDESDQLLIKLRDQGADWDEIVAKWKSLTGEKKVGKSTLPNRYNRLKENFSTIREEDSARLIEAKREVEEAFENTKWARIATLVRRKGGEEYPPVILQRQYKKLMLDVGARPPPGVRDPDFDGVEPHAAWPRQEGDDGGISKRMRLEVSEGEEEEEEEEEEAEEGEDADMESDG